MSLIIFVLHYYLQYILHGSLFDFWYKKLKELGFRLRVI
tara:strand:- start:1620 stop:1736 length:117 start_codon:yes stop_codon:yes gene_type:complete